MKQCLTHTQILIYLHKFKQCPKWVVEDLFTFFPKSRELSKHLSYTTLEDYILENPYILSILKIKQTYSLVI